jgi:hypothetical protein
MTQVSTPCYECLVICVSAEGRIDVWLRQSCNLTRVSDGIVRGKMFSTGKRCGVEDQEVQMFRRPSRSNVVRLPACPNPVTEHDGGILHVSVVVVKPLALVLLISVSTLWVLDHSVVTLKLSTRPLYQATDHNYDFSPST